MKTSTEKTYKQFILIAASITSLIYIGWRTFYTIPFGFGVLAITCGLTLLIAEMSDMFENIIIHRDTSKIKPPVKPKLKIEEFPHVDVFITTFTEPADLLYKTVNGCLHMDYPDKSKVHIYLCDDGNRLEMKELADRMGVNYLSRSENSDAKAGNLNHALKNSASPYIVTLDSDMIPKHFFLTEVIPYLAATEYVGFVQTPQDFYNPDLFQYNLFSEKRIPNEQAYFFHYVQLSRSKTNSAIYSGSNTVISRKALEDVGGFVTGVLTEDYATGLAIQGKGYVTYAIDRVCASGLAPIDLKSLIRQRQRWARGCIQSGRKLNFLFMKGLSMEQKLQYIASTTYWYTGIKRFVYIVAPILFSVFDVVVVKTTVLPVLLFWTPMYFFGTLRLQILSRKTRSTRWNNIIETITFPSLMTAVLLETFYLSKSKFEVTNKVKDDNSSRTYQFVRAIPHIVLAILSVAGIYLCLSSILNTGSMIYAVVLFWLVVNLYNLVMAIFFMLRRTMFRNSERIRAHIPCKLDDGFRVIDCLTYDLSDNGLSVEKEFPLYIPQNTPCKISLETDRYRCDLDAEVARVVCKSDQPGKQDRWLYAFNITGISEQDRQQYFQMIYDREFDLPRNMDPRVGIFDDLRVNVVERNRKQLDHNRKLPRIELNKKLPTAEGGHLTLAKFNYDHAEVIRPVGGEFPPSITFDAGEGIKIHCTYIKTIEPRGGTSSKPASARTEALYSVDNKEELAYSAVFQSLIDTWFREYDSGKDREEKEKQAVTSNV